MLRIFAETDGIDPQHPRRPRIYFSLTCKSILTSTHYSLCRPLVQHHEAVKRIAGG